jgi:ribonuclease Z
VATKLKLHILGCYAAAPRTTTHPTAQVLELRNQLFLIDCGEGTQIELRRYGIRFTRIRHIFISHLHGDHFFGLPGLISTFRLLGREQELHIYGPKGIREAITLLLKLGQSWTNYPLIFHELESREPQQILEDESLTVTTIPLKHRIYTNGFLFAEKPGKRKFNAVAARKYGIDRAYYRKIKDGADFTAEDGTLIKNELLTFDPGPVLKYAYCCDTSYNPEMVPYLKNADVLYHEATFLESEALLSQETGHSTATDAARIAKAADVGTLILGHYSTRYKSISPFREEALAIFPNVELAEDGRLFEFTAGRG